MKKEISYLNVSPTYVQNRCRLWGEIDRFWLREIPVEKLIALKSVPPEQFMTLAEDILHNMCNVLYVVSSAYYKLPFEVVFSQSTNYRHWQDFFFYRAVLKQMEAINLQNNADLLEELERMFLVENLRIRRLKKIKGIRCLSLRRYKKKQKLLKACPMPCTLVGLYGIVHYIMSVAPDPQALHRQIKAAHPRASAAF